MKIINSQDQKLQTLDQSFNYNVNTKMNNSENS